ncbi:ABC transporter ATP-binding protein [Aquamicrobium sp. LC103]|uniref:ABC transporter ATP-binding protein n=1 Tax=Aquamicrobium sp. LC103 TaxID=1120658 RepID=UPI00063E75F8|nr:ABC transporter ATP-binding protein [Aquamicrobium sp. LC103]TKT69809.1 ABC transporter ATP-binding protein [Aquamicrobium sp. LC103]
MERPADTVADSAGRGVSAVAEPLLAVNAIEVVYSRQAMVLHSLSLSVPRHGIVALLGANGAGKTTTMKAISGLLRSERGEITKGTIQYDGQRIDRLDASRMAARGISLVMEGRHAFGGLSVEDNLRVGAFTRRDGAAAVAETLDMIFSYFPRLKERRRSHAGLLSGGEQQMCVIARALMARPRMILLDEPSMGLAPQLVEDIFGIIARLNREEGVTFLLAEQNAAVALRFATHGYLVENGRVIRDGLAAELASAPEIKASYLGFADEGMAGFTERKRWLT